MGNIETQAFADACATLQSIDYHLGNKLAKTNKRPVIEFVPKFLSKFKMNPRAS